MDEQDFESVTSTIPSHRREFLSIIQEAKEKFKRNFQNSRCFLKGLSQEEEDSMKQGKNGGKIGRGGTQTSENVLSYIS